MKQEKLKLKSKSNFVDNGVKSEKKVQNNLIHDLPSVKTSRKYTIEFLSELLEVERLSITDVETVLRYFFWSLK